MITDNRPMDIEMVREYGTLCYDEGGDIIELMRDEDILDWFDEQKQFYLLDYTNPRDKGNLYRQLDKMFRLHYGICNDMF